MSAHNHPLHHLCSCLKASRSRESRRAEEGGATERVAGGDAGLQELRRQRKMTYTPVIVSSSCWSGVPDGRAEFGGGGHWVRRAVEQSKRFHYLFTAIELFPAIMPALLQSLRTPQLYPAKREPRDECERRPLTSNHTVAPRHGVASCLQRQVVHRYYR